jgi:hypothetical protein
VKEVGENGAWYETKAEEGLLEGIFFPLFIAKHRGGYKEK